jgi:hypothetical protein
MLWMTTVSLATAGDGSPAAEWITTQVDDYSRKLYVYRDFSDSRNAFTQRGLMRNGRIADPVMDEACPKPYSGITAIRVNIPLCPFCWSGYYFGNGVMNAGEEPIFDWGEHRAGMNLQGARKLVFYARSEKAKVNGLKFFMGGNGADNIHSDTESKSLEDQTLIRKWQRYEIKVSECDLSYISGGFGWAANQSSAIWEDQGSGYSKMDTSVVIYLDEIYYEFPRPRPSPVFLSSYESVSLDREGYSINSVAYSYDVALTVLALCYYDKISQARLVADGLLFALYNDRTFSASQRGIRNGYSAGDPTSFPGWVSAAGKAPFAKLAGFYDRKKQRWNEDYYSVSYSTGNNAWAVIALLEIWRCTSDVKYLKAACTIADFIHSLKDESKGGFRAGWDGFDDVQQKADYVSTEHCIDIYSAFSQLANALDRSGYKPDAGQTAQSYRDDAKHARAFVLRMYDDKLGLFYTGTTSDGTDINKNVYPLDVNTWGILALHKDSAINVKKIFATIERRFAVAGMYDFDSSCDGIWWEGSLEKVLAEKIAGDTIKYRRQLSIANAAAKSDGSITAADRDGVTTGIWLKNISADGTLTGYEWKYNKRVHVGATAWLAIAQLGVNPLDPDK